MRNGLLCLLVLAGCRAAPYETRTLNPTARADGPRLLAVVAHPDDEIAFAGTLYKTATMLGGRCDVAVVTNGEGGFKYSTLAEPVYGLELTDEEVGRRELPAIRREELARGCDLLGVRNLYFLDAVDHRYTQDAEEVLGESGVWDLEHIASALGEILAAGRYDAVLVLAPTRETHGHHQAAGILALRAVRALPEDDRPAVLAGRTRAADEELEPLREREAYPVTALLDTPPLSFDRRQRFGFRERLDYGIVVDWAIAEHKSQGTMQLLVGQGDVEEYAPFALSGAEALKRVRRLFLALEVPQYPARTYPESAGVGASGSR